MGLQEGQGLHSQGGRRSASQRLQVGGVANECAGVVLAGMARAHCERICGKLLSAPLTGTKELIKAKVRLFGGNDLRKFILLASAIAAAGVLVIAGAVLDQSSSLIRGGIRKAAWVTLGRPLSEDQVHVQYKAVSATGMPASRFVMMGDSLTQFADWPALLNRSDILNLGLAGDTTAGMLDRVKSLNITGNRVLVMGGVNDVLVGIGVDEITSNLIDIVRHLNKGGNTVYLQSTIMTRRPATNKLIAQLIERQRQLCEAENCTFVDVNKSVTKGRDLADAQSVDYVHLNFNGYLLWKDAVAFIFQDKQSSLNIKG